MEKTGKSVIFIDCDCEIKDTPYLLINSLDKYDFAIFNWLSGEGNQTYLPYTPPELSTTYYKPGHSIEFLSKDQLICSGAVQYWSNNTESIALLNFWQTTISNNLGVADDHCLDYAFNNLAGHKVRALWLPKSYARYAWWIFDQPIIDHPQMPSTSLHENNLMNRIYDSNLTATKSADLKGNILIDPSRSRIFTFENDDIVKVEDIAATFYI